MRAFTTNEKEIIEELGQWMSNAPRDLVLIMYGMMLVSTGKVDEWISSSLTKS